MAFLLLLSTPLAWAEEEGSSGRDLSAEETGFEKPEAAERAAYGYDPLGVEYRQNRIEDFQVIFVEAAPFAGLLSFGLAALASYVGQGRVQLKGAYLGGAVLGTAALSTAVALVSVSGKPYPPPDLRAEMTSPGSVALASPLVRLSF